MTKKNVLKFNRRVDAFLAKPLLIEERWGLQQLANYLDDVWEVSTGTSLIDIFKERAEKLAMTTFSIEAGKDNSKRTYSIANIQLRGVMQVEGFISTRGALDIARDIREADHNEDIDFIHISANTGGGDPMAGVIIQNAISDASKPVIVGVEFLASAGVLATLTADHIYLTSEFSDIGSVGAYYSLRNSVLEWIRAEMTYIYAEQSTRKNEGIMEVLEKKKTDLLKKDITGLAAKFIEAVKNNRPISNDQVFTGAMFMGQEGVQVGLADSIGTTKEVLTKLIESNFIKTKNSSIMKELFQKLSGFFGKEINENTSVEELNAAIADKEAKTDGRIDSLESEFTKIKDKFNADITAQVKAAVTDVIKSQVDAAQTALTATIETKVGEVKTEFEGKISSIATEVNTIKAGKSGSATGNGTENHGNTNAPAGVTEVEAKEFDAMANFSLEIV